VTNNVVEHLTAVHELEDDVVIVCLSNDLAGSTDVWMKQNHRQSGLPDRPDLL
jgi:hypothetical protein